MTLGKTLRWSWLLVVVAVLYAAATIYMRRSANTRIEQAAAAKRTEQDRKIVQELGGGEMKILTFYASPPVVPSGGKTLLCYGVASAAQVEIEPKVEEIQPSLSRCVEAHPRQRTEYKLTARDAHGRADTREVTVDVR
jgi:hypothetical protein